MARKSTPVGPVPSGSNEDRRVRLTNLRDRLATAIDDASNRDLAPLAARYQAVLEELSSLPVAGESNGVDDLAARRRSRRRGAAAANS